MSREPEPARTPIARVVSDGSGQRDDSAAWRGVMFGLVAFGILALVRSIIWARLGRQLEASEYDFAVGSFEATARTTTLLFPPFLAAASIVIALSMVTVWKCQPKGRTRTLALATLVASAVTATITALLVLSETFDVGAVCALVWRHSMAVEFAFVVLPILLFALQVARLPRSVETKVVTVVGLGILAAFVVHALIELPEPKHINFGDLKAGSCTPSSNF